MSGKFMKVKKVVIPTLTLIIMASQLMGCAATSQDETLGMLNNATEIEVEVAELDTDKQGKQKSIESIDWIELASLTTNPEIRDGWNEMLHKVILTDGSEILSVFLDDDAGSYNSNNTLSKAMHGSAGLGVKAIARNGEEEFYEKALLGSVTSEYYSDIDNLDMPNDLSVDNEAAYNTAFLAGLNAYFNLLPDYEPAYANMGSSLTRKEFMAMVFRADTPVQELETDKEFSSAVGETEYNLYAQGLKNNSYLDIESQSLNEQTYNGTMTRAEAIYMIVSRYYAEELANIDTDNFTTSRSDILGSIELNTEFTDAKEGGAFSYERGTEYWKADTLNDAIQNPDKGLPIELFSALAIASNHGIINAEEDTRWDEALTKEDALQLLVNSYANNTSSIATEASIEGVDFKTNEEKVADAAAAEEAQLQANIEAYKASVANKKGENPEAYRILGDIIDAHPEYYGDAGALFVGYNVKMGSNGVHHLENTITGHIINIGEASEFGTVYRGQLDCREDMIAWYKVHHSDTDWTDDEIAAYYGF